MMINQRSTVNFHQAVLDLASQLPANVIVRTKSLCNSENLKLKNLVAFVGCFFKGIYIYI